MYTDGSPNPICGNVFIEIHGAKTLPGPANDNNLYESYDFSVTLTMRVHIPFDQIGTNLLSRNIATLPSGIRQGFYRRVEQLRALLHMNWPMIVLQGRTPPSANDNLAAWSTGTIYGFCEPARYQGAEPASIVTGDWFSMDMESAPHHFGVKSELRFSGAKRFQPQTTPAGVFV